MIVSIPRQHSPTPLHAASPGSPAAAIAARLRARDVLALAAVLIGTVVLLGWIFDIPVLKSVLPGWTTVKANTAIGIVGSGLGILSLPTNWLDRPQHEWRLGWAYGAGTVVLLLGALTLVEYSTGLSLGIDELVLADPNTTSPPYPGRMSPASAAGFLCTGGAIVLFAWAVTRSVASLHARQTLAAIAHVLTAGPAAIGYLSLTEYAYNVVGFYRFGRFVAVAFVTALALSLLAAALLLTLPDLGWRRAFADRPAAQGAFVLLMPVALLLPFVAGLFVLWGARAHVYDPLYAPALLALMAAAQSVAMACIATAAVWPAERRLRECNARLEESRTALRCLNEDLEARVSQEVAARELVQAKLVHGQRMEALGQLAGGVAHDVNNVMQAVRGCASLIRSRAADPKAVDHLASMIESSVDRGASVTGRLLSFARRSDLRAEPIDPTLLLADMREVLIHTLGGAIDIRLDYAAAGLPMLSADKSQLETVLVNLATNARDAMPTGGVMTLSAADQTMTADEAVAAGLPASGRYVRLRVSDTGEGMSAQVLARVCEPFFTTKPKGKGTGLGLAMTRGFAEQSGGAMEIGSVAGAGTTISLWLPAAGCSPPRVAADLPHDPVVTPAAQILVVDDEDLVREVLAEGLEERGLKVLRAGTPWVALAMLDAGAVVDLLLTDYTMPEMDGLALIAAARRRRPGLLAVLLTGNADIPQDVDSTLLTPPSRFQLLCKPIAADIVANTIKRLMMADLAKTERLGLAVS